MTSNVARPASGPHLDDILLTSGTRDLRSFGSQGEQRLTVLALILAEAELIVERRGFAPLLLLDDVLSELDPNRRRVLAERVLGTGQTLITATEASRFRRPGTASGGLSGHGEGRVMDRVGDAVARELGRFGPASGMAPVVEAWPLAVGRRDRPQRVAGSHRA